MSLALYRKYRPGSFAELVGQDHVTGPLMQALRSDRVHHAFLFSGPRGCGKTSSARILARSLNCDEGPTPTPCGVCESCVALAPNGPGSMDVIEIDAASHGGVDDARDLRERAFYAPMKSRFKIYIIDEAHMVTSQGFNALLKLVEEPPPHVKFVFATTEPDKVIATIRSRTHSYPFRLVPPSVLRPFLAEICAKEGVAVEDDALPIVVRAGGGSVRDSLSVLDQLIAGAGDAGVTYEGAISLLGFTDVALIDEAVDAIAAADGTALFTAVDRAVESGHDARRFAVDLLERMRDLIVLDAVPDARSRGLIEAPGDLADRMDAQAARLGTANLTRCAEVLAQGLVQMRGTTSPRLLLELICGRLLLPEAGEDPSSVRVRLERLERAFDTSPSAVTAAAPTTPVPSARSADSPSPSAAPPPPAPIAPVGPVVAADPVAEALRAATPAPKADATPPEQPTSQAPAPHAAGIDAATVGRMWPDILAAIRQRSRSAEALLAQGSPASVEGRSIALSFATPALARTFTARDDASVVADALGDVLGGTWTVTVASSAPAPAPAGAPADPTPASASDAAEAAAGVSDDDVVLDAGSGPEAALRLLTSELGAHVIGEVDDAGES